MTLYWLIIIFKARYSYFGLKKKGERGCRIYVCRFICTQNTPGKIYKKLELLIALGVGIWVIEGQKQEGNFME